VKAALLQRILAEHVAAADLLRRRAFSAHDAARLAAESPIAAAAATAVPQRESPVAETVRKLFERYVKAIAAHDFAELEKVVHPEIEVRYPQSGERFRGFAVLPCAARAVPRRPAARRGRRGRGTHPGR
jgi:hypothetical protein